jgi:hypothetical protein
VRSLALTPWSTGHSHRVASPEAGRLAIKRASGASHRVTADKAWRHPSDRSDLKYFRQIAQRRGDAAKLPGCG